MHDAYKAIPIIEKLPLQIESVATCDDNLLIGTRQGHLLMYNVKPVKDEDRFEVQLARSNKYFSKKPVLQMAAVPEFQILVCLSDNIISVHDMTVFNFQILSSISKTRGATLFALDKQKNVSLTGVEVFTLRMCVVVKRKLQLFYWKNRGFHDMEPELSVPDVPKALVWCAEALCVGFKQEYCLIKLSGRHKGLIPTGKSMEPYILRLKDDRLALSTDDKTVFLDFEGKPTHRNYVTWSECPVSLEHDPPYLLSLLSNHVEIRTIEPRIHVQNINLTKPKFITTCSNRGQIIVASHSYVWCLTSVPINQQINSLLKGKHFELALDLVNLMNDANEDKQKLKHQIQNLYAFHLFCDHKFKDSMDIFLQLGTDPSHVIGLFPDLLPMDYRNQLEYPDKLPDLEGIELENGLLALIEYLIQVRHSMTKTTQNKTIQNSTALVEGSATIKNKIQLLQIIDTTLVKCYLRTNDTFVASLLRLPENYCHEEETEQVLKQYQKFNDLIILYRCKNLHEKALDLLHCQAHIEDSFLKDHDHTIQYLQHLGREHLSLIFKFAKWVLQEFPEDGLRIFTGDVPEVENLPREEVFNYLRELCPHLVIQYLEHVIFVWKDTSALFHNSLALEYQHRVIDNSTSVHHNAIENCTSDDHSTAEIVDWRKKLKSFLEDSSHYVPEALLVQLPENDLFEERAIIMGKLGRHEQALAIYTAILESPDLAEDYCLKVYNSGAEGSENVYLKLLEMYVNPPKAAEIGIHLFPVQSAKSNLASAKSLLQNHPARIDPLMALEIIPGQIQVNEIKSYLEHVLQERIAAKRSSQVLRGLLYSDQLQIHEQRIICHAQKIIINDLDMCSHCKKRIGMSAFVQYPSGEIVHFYCHDKHSAARQRVS